TGIDFENVYNYAQSLDFQKGIIHFIGEKTPEEVANWMQNSDFFVLFSNYENSPVVIAESLVCGKPVISTNVGGISELINKSNGILIEKGNEIELIEQMNKLLDHFEDYDSSKIKAESRNKFSYESIGLSISKIYDQIII
ncbi:MAG TPA: glycosyltransferase family 4 protein, partial [Paludibacter sp.]|nr:glycosyltransferase family 4 protein [Paludibacter sp.]